jgi:hypothetical protein
MATIAPNAYDDLSSLAAYHIMIFHLVTTQLLGWSCTICHFARTLWNGHVHWSFIKSKHTISPPSSHYSKACIALSGTRKNSLPIFDFWCSQLSALATLEQYLVY